MFPKKAVLVTYGGIGYINKTLYLGGVGEARTKESKNGINFLKETFPKNLKRKLLLLIL